MERAEREACSEVELARVQQMCDESMEDQRFSWLGFRTLESKTLTETCLPLRLLVLVFSGQHVKHFCTQTSDTVCADCEEGTYTKLWNRLPTCLSCGSRCGDGKWPERDGPSLFPDH